MASETKTKKDDMAADTTVAITPADDDNERRRGSSGGGNERPPERAAAAKPGFFTIYKKGQGYWTRMGTAIGAVVLGGLIVWQIYRQVPAFMSTTDLAKAQRVGLIAAAVFATAFGLFAWRLMNKPSNVDFLIATDGEMKKVNWTSKRELIGSTKVVIFFMFTIAVALFTFDLLFNTLFYFLHVIRIPFWEQLMGK